MKGAGILRVPPGTTVAFQGELGAFSQRASYQVFGKEIEPLPCVSFDEVFEKASKKRAKLAIIPIENSLAGSIHQNYDLLSRHRLEAIAETYVRIEHHLIAHRGLRPSQIKQIYSHPVALAQCQKFLRKMRKAEKVSFYDTAGSVKYIREKGLREAAAIASADAARIYEMSIIQRSIEDNRENYTRFLALARRGEFSSGGEKTTVVFGLKNEPGALFKALSVFALRNIDLTKIESRPIHGKPWEYLFYLDLQSDSRSRECSNALRHLQEMTLYFRVLGSYPTC
jgi:prephenate dehydratase